MELMNMQKQQELLKAATLKQIVKNQEMELQEKKRQEIAERKARTRQELQQKIIQENQRRLQIEVSIAQDIIPGKLARLGVDRLDS